MDGLYEGYEELWRDRLFIPEKMWKKKDILYRPQIIGKTSKERDRGFNDQYLILKLASRPSFCTGKDIVLNTTEVRTNRCRCTLLNRAKLIPIILLIFRKNS